MQFYKIRFLFFSIFILFQTTSTFGENPINSKLDSLQTILRSKFSEKPLVDGQLKKLNKDWSQLQTKLLKPLKYWINNQNFSFQNETKTLYYPFGGPDILFAKTFFPKANTYILVGLENTGNVPTFNLKNEKQLANYLNKLNFSFRYLNKAGYFVTKQMTKDLQQPELNGVIHLFILSLTKLNCKIEKITYPTLNKYGQLIETKNKMGNIIQIKFLQNNKIQELIYFKQNLSNKGLNNNLNFELFLKNLSPLNSYMKSASYILFNNDFNLHRNFILKNCSTIVQDDSGIPYPLLLKYFNVKTYGIYTQTSKSFKYGYQESLKTASENNSPLPFKLGYNQWINETILLYANKYPKKQKDRTKNNYKFGVQIAALSNPSQPKKLKINGKIPFEIKENNQYKYVIGYFSTIEECTKQKLKIQKLKYPKAFIVIFKNNKKISIEEYNKQLKRNLN